MNHGVFFVHNSLSSRLYDYHVRVPIILNVCENQSVWKGICETQDFAKLLRGLQENIKYPYGIQDFTATRESGFAKIWGRDV